MRVDISPGDTSLCALQGADISRFVKMLANDESFERCALGTSWGLLVCQFFGPEGKTTVPISLQVLDILRDNVIGNDGAIVDRYEQLVQEMIATAHLRIAHPHTPLNKLPASPLTQNKPKVLH